ncbi:hypothetical protein DFH06DRAFT_1347995 [Mycena polygramma]|nr:hypothetical protein DFH06DRAFT_1347995 [Mycena polygramma]
MESTTNAVEEVLKATRLDIAVAKAVMNLIEACMELHNSPLGDTLQAIFNYLAACIKLEQDAHITRITHAIDTQELIMSRAYAYKWLSSLVISQLHSLADLIVIEKTLVPPTQSIEWAEQLLHFVDIYVSRKIPNKHIVRMTSQKKHLQLEKLAELQLALEGDPITTLSSATSVLLRQIGEQHEWLCQHKKMPSLLLPHLKLTLVPEDMLIFLRMALKLVSKPGALAVYLEDNSNILEAWRLLLKFIASNTDLLLSIRASAQSYATLSQPGSSLSKDHLYSVESLFSMGNPKDFCKAIDGIPVKEFVFDNCYDERTQIMRSRNWKAHTDIVWKTANNLSTNWWLLSKPQPLPLPKGKKSTTSTPTPTKLLAPAEKKKAAERKEKAREGGALGTYHSGVLHYQVQCAFVQLYRYLDKHLTCNEKDRIHWNPICLEHVLCKFLRFISNSTYLRPFKLTYYITTQFSSTH